ncbi:DUF6491 family protein [Kordiimonas marina]|uniref:DUF6491 family protein n=1 Tax=Kordiimonas marina TaxID=2872312 RepID=UPI001FF1C531|nr:DUF6491 family protein [Kordiimonas marina]MCJ9427939.1 DUF6491 family protein [Kordiimonas marina]
MINKMIVSCVAGVAFAMTAGTAFADDGKQDKDKPAATATAKEPTTRAEKRMADLMKKYELTGAVRSCIPIGHMRDSNVIDDQTIFFRTSAGTGYLNRLPNKCPRLGFERRFMYKTSMSQLCSLDIITVLDSSANQWASCGLGKFEEMKRKDTKDTKEK